MLNKIVFKAHNDYNHNYSDVLENKDFGLCEMKKILNLLGCYKLRFCYGVGEMLYKGHVVKLHKSREDGSLCLRIGEHQPIYISSLTGDQALSLKGKLDSMLYK